MILALGSGCSSGDGGGGVGGGDGGADGGTCAPGTQDEDGDGTCLADCSATTCDHGTCTITAGVAGCECDPGYAGDTCAALDAPAASSVAFWIDAADADTVTASGDYLASWSDKGRDALSSLVDADDAGKPKLVPDALHGLPVVRFDGNGDYVRWNGFAGITDEPAYTVFMVVSAGLEQGVFLGGVDDDLQGGFEVRAGSGSDSIEFAHVPAGDTMSSVTSTGLGFSQPAAHLLTLQRTNARMTVWIDGRHRFDAPTANGLPLDANVNLVAGMGTTADLLGDVAEVLVFDGALDLAARQKVEAYLGVKWLGAAPEVDPTGLVAASLWLDASGAASISLNGANVAGWTNLGNAGGSFSVASVDAQPVRVASGTNGRAVVRFDGDDRLIMNDFDWLGGNAYAIFAVLVPPATGDTSTALSALDGSDPGLTLDIRPTDGLAALTHRWPSGTTGGDVASVSLGTAGTPILIEAQRSGTAITLTVGDTSAPATGTAAEIDAATLNLVLGADSATSPTTPFTGDVAEVILVNGFIENDERTALVDWLASKWGL